MIAGNPMSKIKTQILVVDDEVYIQEISKSTMEDAGYECVAVGDAESALTVLASHSFDIALLDVRMAGKKARTFFRTSKKHTPKSWCS